MKRLAVWITCFSMMLGLSISVAQSETYQEKTAQQELNLSSPESTWNEFRNTVTAGNFTLAEACFYSSENRTVKRYKKLGKVKANRVFKTIKSIEKVYQDEDSAKYMVHRDINGKNLTTYVSFAKIDDQWKIDKY